ncbi:MULTISPECIES: hypothetical protein [Rhodopseudomonas]|uniref:Cysteine rich repeat protein n=1 Tax=Rhodopseudomonas palustris TaxID=1076 RepID=A0A0D7ECE5_RHOPL|nr:MULTISPECIES: hypothetical protein [Rhodopseudomonas]KIZ38408.1 hypothetical protein OO17_22810 [Rhodopseudomonas palustris]MDF3811426.1 hypothetical protein [Rhodopseudomonas sp. BAL398]WOK16277.1 hypothetical protein RBJ75_19230 [Rhodopseudomonas sp. BAL398]
MKKIAGIAAIVLVASAASAQQGRPRHDPGCARDVSRFCRALMDQDDMVILACLQQHRAKLSKSCAKALADHGQ